MKIYISTEDSFFQCMALTTYISMRLNKTNTVPKRQSIKSCIDNIYDVDITHLYGLDKEKFLL